MNNYTAKFRTDNKPVGKRKYSKRSSGEDLSWKSPWSKDKTMSECLKEERERLFGERRYGVHEEKLSVVAREYYKKNRERVIKTQEDYRKRKKLSEVQS